MDKDEWVDYLGATNLINMIASRNMYGWYDQSSEMFSSQTPEREPETNEQKVIRLLRGDFEKKLGISFEDFMNTYNHLVETNPDKLI